MGEFQILQKKGGGVDSPREGGGLILREKGGADFPRERGYFQGVYTCVFQGGRGQ